MNIKFDLENLELLNGNIKEVFVKARRGKSKVTRIPLILDEELAFFIAVVIGDGHLKKDKKQISIELTNEDLLVNINKVVYNLFKINFNISKRKERPNHKNSFILILDNTAIYNLIKKSFKIPSGKKSNIVNIPTEIINANKSIIASFLIGIMVTEGGKRKRGIGLSTASQELWINLIDSFNKLNIRILKDKWTYHKYNKEYYGLVFKKDHLTNLIDMCDNTDIRKIIRSCENLKV
ncbi:MAG: hypothetical protein Q7R87_02335 [Nanoarchaeota archaeon]|nr:hypothetical protein [Nanoarchaeota archaeon]